MHDKRYYWLKLEENYFDLKVQKALRKLPSGAEMLICYLKMQLKYLNKSGLIEFNNICSTLSEEIALDIDEDIDLVNMTLSVLSKWNVLETIEDGILITEMQNRIGSKTDSAVRMAKLREKQKMSLCDNIVQKSDPIKEIDIEKEKDIEIDKDNIFDFIEKNFGRTINPIEYEIIREWEDNDLTRYAIKQAVLNNAYSIKYIETILNNWKKKNIRTVQEAQQDNEKHSKKAKYEEKLPEWFDKEQTNEELTKEEEEEFKNLLDSF